MEMTEDLIRGIVREIFDGAEKVVIANKTLSEQVKSKKTAKEYIIEYDFSKPFTRYNVLEELSNHFST